MRFGPRFSIHPGSDGESRNEVPVAMVALIATAVSEVLFHCVRLWYVNSYLDIYKGHVNMIEFVKTTHPGAFHTMMAELYTQAR